MFPYLDLAGLKSRTIMPSTDVDLVEGKEPGFTATRIRMASSYINARLRKRYGNSGNANALPFGQSAPTLIAAGTAPPAVTLVGRPTLGSVLISIRILKAGSLGTATYQWSADGGTTWSAETVTTAEAVLDLTGLTANFPTGTSYASDNQYAAAAPVPEAILGWIVDLVTVDLYLKRGVNPQDPTIQTARDARTEALANIKEAADSKEGLFDLPVSEDQDSAVTTGGPQGYSEQSPYTWTDIEHVQGGAEDAQNSNVLVTGSGSIT